MTTNSSRKRGSRKTADRPKKPYTDFPLSPHASGKWQKKIRGSIYYFGNWVRHVDGKLVRVDGDGWKEALALYKAQADDLHTGRVPQATPDDKLTVKLLCNTFLTAMYKRLQVGKKMTNRTFAQYKATAEFMAAALGKNRQVANLAPADFAALGHEFAKRYGVVHQGNEVQRVRTIFKYGLDNGLLPKAPNFGSEFKKPTKDEYRKARAANAKRFFTAVEIRELLAGAEPQLRAMLLLGINCGLGNMDVASLPQAALDLDNAMLDFPRPKNGIERRCPLWPETVAALQVAMADRPKPINKADAGCVFITVRGHRWVRDKVTKPADAAADDYSTTKVVSINSVSKELGKLLQRLGINGRKGLGFYSLRHTFRTIADSARDHVAANLIMGHTDATMAAVYREHVDDERLLAVVQHVHAWLFGTEGGAA